MIGLPKEGSYYWATHAKYGWRTIVLLKRNGHRHLRVYAPRFSSSFGIEEFKDWSKEIAEAKK